MRRSAEVGIVGAGPAGSRTAALLAAKGIEVLLLDPKTPWEKPCGGGLPAALFDELSELEDLKSLARPVHRARVALTSRPAIELALDQPIWMISRHTLGRWQLDRALQAGAYHERVKVRSLSRSGNGWMLETVSGPVTVSHLIGADGAASTVRNAAAPDLAVELAPTRVAYPLGAGRTPDTLVLQFDRGLTGYVWDFPRLDHRSVGIMACDGTWRRAALDGAIDEFRAVHKPGPLAAPRRAGAVIGTAQLGHGDFSGIAGDRFALVGDAAGFADPFTGEGIHNALRSAGLLAEAWEAGVDELAQAYAGLAREAFGTQFTIARLLRRTLGESGLGVRLVGWAASSALAYSFVAATLDAVSGKTSLSRFLARWYGTLKDARAAAA
jgi:flavin-dependent dehydrogenase